jgi:hypothetical protein
MPSLTELLKGQPALFNLALEQIQFCAVFWLEQVFESSLHAKEVVEGFLVRIHVQFVFSFLDFVEWEIPALHSHSSYLNRLFSLESPT